MRTIEHDVQPEISSHKIQKVISELARIGVSAEYNEKTRLLTITLQDGTGDDFIFKLGMTVCAQFIKPF